MVLNLTCEGLSAGQVIEASHKLSAVPSIWITIIACIMAFSVIGIFVVNIFEKPKITWIIVLGSIACIIIGVAVTFMPHAVQWIMNIFS